MRRRKGINVGDEWTYRSYIEGGTPGGGHLDVRRHPARAVSRLAAGRDEHRRVPHLQGQHRERALLGSLAVRNPKTGLTVEVEVFESKEFATKQIVIPRKIDRFSNAQMISRKMQTPQGVVLDSAAGWTRAWRRRRSTTCSTT